MMARLHCTSFANCEEKAQQGARANDHSRHAACYRLLEIRHDVRWRTRRAGCGRGSSLTFGKNMWRTFEGGTTLGARGSEEGVIVIDEEHERGARITLERDCRRAPLAITCGIYGTFMHTVFAASESEARRKYSDMRRDLASILEESDSSPCYERIRLFTDVY